MAIHVINSVGSLKDYIEVINDIGKKNKIDEDTPPVLWFRGHRMDNWNLRPTLYRDIPLGKIEESGGRLNSQRAVAEEMRKQHYIAKNYHFLSKIPETSIEWMEIMQHHGVKTRWLDWSESSMHALLFALEVFLNANVFRRNDRLDSSPCMWVFDPISWNKNVLKKILENEELIGKCLDIISISSDDKICIMERLKALRENEDIYLWGGNPLHIDTIFNLGGIVKEFEKLDIQSTISLLKNGELINCLFFIIKLIYSSNMQNDYKDVLPLAVVQSYHSDRIKAQKGVFTVFPYYNENSRMLHLKELSIFPDAMELMDGNQYLYKIRLRNPYDIAFELMNAGMNMSWLYPEMPMVANEIEGRHVLTR